MDRKAADNNKTMDAEMKVNMVRLMSSDGEIFELEEEAASQSQAIKSLIETLGTDEPIQLPYVSRKILATMVRICKSKLESQNLLKRSNQKS
ncbi:hypothetical protein MPTK1_5g00650 [Marchantia polymorpha subsp. ruderalis]|uniref:SKP1 component POZ domain-containing protein n=2 Tax=Marchantia polymorpha TaxID=3197 RepID=A0AAF6BDI6_MARPO|nr:hypothetical protein MARPO_0078s0064 [Marchantia polymorpha]BBN10070.1 hypothetical protein Mp_5g00650 [Marchantia polymorpha subsp. ruderalis]|eukprot:PTQ34663.1 hypothetical protein MARPO_0078s0064 [Marchantia polymorpha]